MTQAETMILNQGPGRTDLTFLRHGNESKAVENGLPSAVLPLCTGHVQE